MSSDAMSRILDLLANSDLSEEIKLAIFAHLENDFGSTPDTSDNDLIHLKSIQVRGFRGIGQTSTLELDPGNGLTFVVGGNGTGKSSFAEALECVLSGTTKRWNDSKPDGKKNWRNIHYGTSPLVKVTLRGRTSSRCEEIKLSWKTHADFDEGQISSPTTGEATLETIRQKVATYPPLLPHAELDRMANERQSDLFDALNPLLGLSEVDAVMDKLAEKQRISEVAMKSFKKTKKELINLATEDSDAEVQRIGAEIRDGTLSPQKAVQLLAFETGLEERRFQLYSLSGLAEIDLEYVEAAVNNLTAHQQRATELENALSATSSQVVDLLALALEIDQQKQDSTCPVCGVQTITDEWRTNTRELLGDRQQKQYQLEKQLKPLQAQRKELLEYISAYSLAPLDGVDESIGLAAAASKVEQLISENKFSMILDSCLDLASQVEVASAAAEVLATLESEVGNPLHSAAISWLNASKTLVLDQDELFVLKKAKTWMGSQIDLLRTERLSEINGQVLGTWAKMNPSNAPAIEPLQLNGRKNKRVLNLRCVVGEEDVNARSILSQGQLHALALSVFLPRALRKESPFGFLVIDDPVQAFDSSKIEGLASILGEISTSRQVVVFTHDKRLPETASILGIEAQIVEVSRGENSVVKTTRLEGPWHRAIKDARATLKDNGLDTTTKTLLVASSCAIALEAKAIEEFRLKAYRDGASIALIDEQSRDVKKLWDKISLGLNGKIERGTAQQVERRFGKKMRKHISFLNNARHPGNAVDQDPTDVLELSQEAIRSLFGGKSR